MKLPVLFRKRSKRSIPPPYRKQSDSTSRSGGLYPIEFDMMLKGSITQRHGVSVRQFGVYVNGSTRLVTSGDHVDRETYEALIAEGAIQRPAEGPLPAREAFEKASPRMIEDSGTETRE